MAKVHITDKWVRGVKGDSHTYQEFWDEKLDGFGCRVSPDGTKTWNVVCRRGQAKRRHTLGTYPETSVVDAREDAADKIREFRRNDQVPRSRRLSFREFAMQYLEEHAKQKKVSWRQDQERINGKLLPAFGNLRASDVTRQIVISFLKPLRKDTPVQANRVKSLLSKMYNWGIGENLVDHNPAHQIPSEDEGGGKDRVYSEEEVRKIWSALETLTLPERSYYQFAFMTGQRLGSNMRLSTGTLEKNRLDDATIQDRLKKRSKADDRGEILFMEWDEVDSKNGWWVIPSVRTKNRLEHRVPLVPQAVALLRAVQEHQRDRKLNTKYVWVMSRPGRTKLRPPRYTRNQYLKVRQLSGVADFSQHDIRRTVGTMMTSSGVPREDVGKLFNHISNSKRDDVTGIYDRHSYDSLKKDIVAFWSLKLHAILKKQDTSSLNFTLWYTTQLAARSAQAAAASTPAPQSPPEPGLSKPPSAD